MKDLYGEFIQITKTYCTVEDFTTKWAVWLNKVSQYSLFPFLSTRNLVTHPFILLLKLVERKISTSVFIY